MSFFPRVLIHPMNAKSNLDEWRDAAKEHPSVAAVLQAMEEDIEAWCLVSQSLSPAEWCELSLVEQELLIEKRTEDRQRWAAHQAVLAQLGLSSLAGYLRDVGQPELADLLDGMLEGRAGGIGG